MNFLNKDGLNYLIQKIKSLELKNFSNTTGFAKYDSSTLGNYSFTFTIKSLDLANNKVLLETTDSSIGDWISSKGYRYASIPFDTVFESCKLYIVYNDIEYPIMQSKNNPLYSDYKDSASEVYLGFTDGIFYLNTNVYQLEQNLPTKMSQLENDSNYVSDENYVHTDNNYTTEDMNKLNGILDTIYPVGSIYMSINSVDPSTLFGGVWEQIKDKFLLACGDAYENGSTGGEAEHTLTENEMPSHTHVQNAHNHKPTNSNLSFANVLSISNGTTRTQVATSTSSNKYVLAQSNSGVNYQTTSGSTGNYTATNENTGGGLAHNNMPPYLSVYMWKRIS